MIKNLNPQKKNRQMKIGWRRFAERNLQNLSNPLYMKQALKEMNTQEKKATKARIQGLL